MVEPITLLAAATTLLKLASATGLIRTATDRALDEIGADVRSLVMAPLYEGLDRINHASAIADHERRQRLLAEASSKLHDAAVQPRMPGRARALASTTAAALARVQGHEDEAREWLRRAMDTHDSVLTEWTKVAVKAQEMQTTARRPRGGPSWAGLALGMPLLPSAEAGARLAIALTARKNVPSAESLAEFNSQVSGTLQFAEQMGCELKGHLTGLKIERRGSRIIDVHIERHP